MTNIISLLLTEEISYACIMILIIVIFTVSIAGMVIIILSKTSLFKKWAKKGKGKSLLTLDTLDVLGLRKVKRKENLQSLKVFIRIET